MLLILFLNSTFKLYYLKDILTSDLIDVDNIVYTKDYNSIINEGFIGFFDWLRTNEDTICGIRMCYFDDLPYNNILVSLPYVNSVFLNKYAELLFKGDHYRPDLSGDQDFINNYVYTSASGNYLLTFGLDHLTDEELNSVLIHCEIIDNTSC